MPGISDAIELFILQLFDDSENIELGRNELAQYFNCAPSQINYVLATRFTLDKGYIITSKRGGGGSIKIMKVVETDDDMLTELVTNRLRNEISAHEAANIVERMLDREVITGREAAIILAAIRDLPMTAPDLRPYLRANLLRNILIELLKGDSI